MTVTPLISLKRQVALASALVACVLMGGAIATSSSAVPVTAILLIVIGAVVTFAMAAEVALVALIATSPLALEGLTGGERSLLESFGGWAVSSVRLGVLLLVGLAVLALRGLPRRLVPEEYVYMGLIAWIATTLLFSPDQFAGVRITAKIAVLLVAWLAFGWVVRRFGIRFMWRLLLVTLAAALFVDFILIAQGLSFHHYPDAPRRFAGLAEPASGALSLSALALPALFLWFRERHRVALILYLLTWIPVLMSVTRIAIIGFALSSIVLAAVMRHWLQSAAIAFTVSLVLLSYAPLRERMAFGSDAQSWRTITATFQNEGVEGLNTQGRTELWSDLARQYHVHPIEGSGVGASEEVLRSSGRFTQGIRPGRTGGVSQAHSDYMALLVNGGIIALVLWLLALGGLALRFLRAGGVAAPAAAAVILFLLAALTDNAIDMYAQLGIPVAALVAIALAGDGGDDRHGRTGGVAARLTLGRVGTRGPEAGGSVA